MIGKIPRTEHSVEHLFLPIEPQTVVLAVQPSQVESHLPGASVVVDENGMILKLNWVLMMLLGIIIQCLLKNYIQIYIQLLCAVLMVQNSILLFEICRKIFLPFYWAMVLIKCFQYGIKNETIFIDLVSNKDLTFNVYLE